MTDANPIDIAVKAVGSQQMLANFLGVSRPTIAYWKKNKEFPNAWLKRVQQVTQLPIHLLLSKEQTQILSLSQLKVQISENDENGTISQD